MHERLSSARHQPVDHSLSSMDSWAPFAFHQSVPKITSSAVIGDAKNQAAVIRGWHRRELEMKPRHLAFQNGILSRQLGGFFFCRELPPERCCRKLAKSFIFDFFQPYGIN
jgi:hypothetical protein